MILLILILTHFSVTSHLQVAANLRAQCSSAVNRSNALVNKRPRGSIAWRQLRAQISEKENQCTKLIRIIEERQFELEKGASASACVTRH